MIKKTSQLLELLSSGHQLTVDDLESLINNKIKEDQFLEFKSGKEVEEKDTPKTIRDYLCGFANSDGGVLIVGIDAPGGIATTVDGCNNHKKGNLAEWASRCLTPVASYFSPIPKIQVLQHPNGELLVCVVQRSLNLIPQIENQQLVYYLRIHDQTLKAPEYLISDLLLGRKQKPDLEIVNGEIKNFSRHVNNDVSAMDLGFQLRLKCENRNIAWVEDGKWGIIAWNQFKDPYSTVSRSKPSGQLLSYIDVQDLSKDYQNRPGELLHFNHDLYLSKPFDTGPINLELNTPIRLNDKWFSYEWMAALYLVSKNTPPIWYQIKIKISNYSIQWVDEKVDLSMEKNSEVFSVKRLASERPVVALKSDLS